jgi:hypothetical protein
LVTPVPAVADPAVADPVVEPCDDVVEQPATAAANAAMRGRTRREFITIHPFRGFSPEPTA